MIRIIMHGCNGRMGQMISDICKEEEEVKIVAGIDVAEVQNLSYPVFTDITKCDVKADVMIDFSTAKAADAVLDYCVEKQLPLVFCRLFAFPGS